MGDTRGGALVFGWWDQTLERKKRDQLELNQRPTVLQSIDCSATELKKVRKKESETDMLCGVGDLKGVRVFMHSALRKVGCIKFFVPKPTFSPLS